MRLSVLVTVSIALASCGGAASGVAAPRSAAPATYATPAAQATSADSSSGSYGDYHGYGGTPAPKAASPSGPLQLLDSAKLGKVLAASSGLTLYTNKNDTAKSSACSGACAQTWPPLLTTSSAPAAPAGLKGTLGVVTWSDGTVQVTLNGQPLYIYAGDLKAGDANGDGIDGIWSAAKN